METTREQRGLDLYRTRGAEIEWIGPGTYLVPGSREIPYTVDVGMGFCSCPDSMIHRSRGEDCTCKHIYATEIRRSKRRAARSIA